MGILTAMVVVAGVSNYLAPVAVSRITRRSYILRSARSMLIGWRRTTGIARLRSMTSSQDPSSTTPMSSRFHDNQLLDNPVWSSLLGADLLHGTRHGAAAAYLSDISPFVAVEEPTAQAWSDLEDLVGNREVLIVGMRPPSHWTSLGGLVGMQLVDTAPTVGDSHGREITLLTQADVPDMLDLVERTKPGPFCSGTIELGDYFGIRRDGQLIAMAGERMHPAGWTEVSAVCTDLQYRGEGLAQAVMNSVRSAVRARGNQVFLHVKGDNTSAIGLYSHLGFSVRRQITIYFGQFSHSA